MNILFISDSYLHAMNGIVNHILLVKKELQKRNHHVTILAPKSAKKNTDPDVLCMPSMKFFLRPQDRLTMPFNKKIEKYLLNSPIDIIHCHQGLLAFMGTKIANKKEIPQIITSHTSIEEYFSWLFPWLQDYSVTITRRLTQMYFNQYDLAIAPSNKAENVLKRAHVSVPIKLLHNGIKLENFQNANPQLFLKKYSLNARDPLLVLVGRIDIGKNVHIAIHAMKKVVREIPNARLAIIGDGNLRKNIEKLVRKLGLDKNVFITGFISLELVASANQAAKIALMTSDSDTLPTVAIEAITCGKPMVAVKDEAINAIVKNKINGFLTAKDPAKIANAIITLLKNHKLRKKYGDASLKMAEKFSIQKYIDKLENIYQEIIDQKKSKTQLL